MVGLAGEGIIREREREGEGEGTERERRKRLEKKAAADQISVKLT